MSKVKRDLINDFLIKEKYRVWRHVLLIFVVAFIAVNGVLGILDKSYFILGYKTYWIFFFSLILDLIVIYFNLYILVPKLLLRTKYLQYITILSFAIFCFLLINLFCEYYIFKFEGIIFGENSPFYSITNLIIQSFTSFVIYMVFIVSISMTRLFKNWSINAQRVNQLEAKELRSQLEDMKTKISPPFLSRILKRTALLALSDPLESSAMLVTLSKILRYQLYDCNREKALLSSEITFLANYLNLEHSYCRNFNFEINKAENMAHIFIPPLLFLPFIQRSILKLTDREDIPVLKLRFEVNNGQLKFFLDNGIGGIDYSDINSRIERLYPNRYLVDAKDEKILTIQTEI